MLQYRVCRAIQFLKRRGIRIKPSVLRFWENAGIIKSERSTANQRIYSESELVAFAALYPLRRYITLRGMVALRRGKLEKKIQEALEKTGGNRNEKVN